MSRIRGVILDIDGTLLNSNDAHARAWRDALLERKGLSIPFERIRALIGMGSDHLLPELTGIDVNSREGQELVDRKNAIFRERYLEKLKPFPAAREFVSKLRERGLSVTVASSAGAGDLNEFLDRLAIRELVEEPTSSDDARRSKPESDLVVAALEKLDLPPEEAVMIGDTPYDIEAATRAGVKSIAFLTGGWPKHALAGAEQIYDGPGALLADLDGSILARRSSIF